MTLSSAIAVRATSPRLAWVPGLDPIPAALEGRAVLIVLVQAWRDRIVGDWRSESISPASFTCFSPATLPVASPTALRSHLRDGSVSPTGPCLPSLPPLLQILQARQNVETGDEQWPMARRRAFHVSVNC